MPESNDTRLTMSKGGTPLHPRECWSEGSEADGSAGAEFTVPSGATYCVFFSSVAAFCATTTEAALDIAGAGFNAMGIAAGGYSLPLPCEGKSKVAIKAVSGNLAVVTCTFYGTDD